MYNFPSNIHGKKLVALEYWSKGNISYSVRITRTGDEYYFEGKQRQRIGNEHHIYFSEHEVKCKPIGNKYNAIKFIKINLMLYDCPYTIIDKLVESISE